VCGLSAAQLATGGLKVLASLRQSLALTAGGGGGGGGGGECFPRVNCVAVPQALHARRGNRCEGMAELHTAIEAVEAAEEEEEGNVFDGPIGRADEEGGLGSSEVAVTLPSSARAPPPPAQLELEPRWSACRATAQSARRAEVRRPLNRPQ
jgi:hypothetical protein